MNEEIKVADCWESKSFGENSERRRDKFNSSGSENEHGAPRIIRVAELFAGIGGFRLGLEMANKGTDQRRNIANFESEQSWKQSNHSTHQQVTEDNASHRSSSFEGGGKPQLPVSFRIVWANDWKWADAKSKGGRWNEQKQYYEVLDPKTGRWKKGEENKSGEIYQKQWTDGTYHDQDICTVDPNDIPNVDVIVGGFPCQPFSMAGNREGFEDIRGTLFFEIMRIAQAKRPKILLLENVKGLLSHDNGDTFETILRTLGESGYWYEYKVLNSKYFGVPQNRERVFIIGHLREGSTRQIFPITSDDSENTEVGEVAGTLQGGGHSGGLHSNMTAILADNLLAINATNPENNQKERTYHVSNTVRTLKNFRGNNEPLIWQLPRNKDRKCLYETDEPLQALRTCQRPPNPNIIAQALQTDGYLRSGSSFGTDNPRSSRNIRRLTPTECERLQGFPDSWTEGVSDTQRYKCLGNAVTVNVITALGKLILEAYP